MKKNKGFTLVELIAVITLLSLIVLVSVPVIINTLSNSEQKEYEKFEQMIENAAELYLERNRDLYPNFAEIGDVIDINAEILIDEGYLKGDLADPIDNNNVSKYKVVISIENDEILEYQIVKRMVLSELATTTDEIKSINSCAISGICPNGTEFALQVNDKEIYNFYVINDDGNKVTLIMDRNIGNTVAWLSENDYNNIENYARLIATSTTNYGPITALNYLNNQTLNWTNIEAINNYTYNNNPNGTTNTNGYQKLEIVNGVGTLTSQDGLFISKVNKISRARLLEYEEVNKIYTENNSVMPTYLYENLYTDTNTSLPYAYWFLTSDRVISSYSYVIDYIGTFENSYGVNLDTDVGVRPVITVSRSL